LQLLYAQDNTPPPITFSGGYTFDLAGNVAGGVDQGTAYLGNIDLNFDFDTQALNLWKGGHFFVYLLNNHGNSLSELMGDFQVANNIEAESNTRLYELWYEHNFSFWSVLVGQHDLNSTFAKTDTGFFFVNSSFGIQPDLSTNVPTSIFPLATLGIVIRWRIGENFKVLHAMYDGDPGSESENPNSLKWSLSNEEGALLINELQYEVVKETETQATYKIGFWKHTQDQIVKNTLFSNSHGIYGISDHVLFRNENTKGVLSIFSQLGFSLNEHNPVKSYLGGGVLYQGISTKRSQDAIGLALAHNVFSETYRSSFTDGIQNETAFEFSYRLVTNTRWFLQPNVQYVINPGTNSNIPNALMGMVRFNYSW